MALINRFRVVWTGVAGTPAYSNFYFINGGAGINAQGAALRSMIFNGRSMFLDNVTANFEPDVPTIDSVTGDIQYSAVSPLDPVTGVNTDDPLPPATQILVRMGTGQYQNGRELRGRWFVPYIGRNLVTNGQLDPLTVTSINNFVSPLIIGSSNTWCVWSRKTGAVAAVESVSTWNQFAVLRSRRD